MTEHSIDVQWLTKLKGGDRKAVHAFVENYGTFIYNVVYKILLHPYTAEEATQDTVLKVLRALDSYDPKSSFKAWCYTIAYRTAIDYKRRIKYTSDISAGVELADAVTADTNMESLETRKNLFSLLQHLDDEARMIITLFYLEEKSIKEMMSITGLTESNIKIKLFRARKELAVHAPKYFEHA